MNSPIAFYQTFFLLKRLENALEVNKKLIEYRNKFELITISPCDCINAIRLLESFLTSIEGMTSVLSPNAPMLPSQDYDFKYFTLKKYLFYIKDKYDTLIDLLFQLRSVCLETSTEKRRLQNKICLKIQVLNQVNFEIINQIKFISSSTIEPNNPLLN